MDYYQYIIIIFLSLFIAIIYTLFKLEIKLLMNTTLSNDFLTVFMLIVASIVTIIISLLNIKDKSEIIIENYTEINMCFGIFWLMFFDLLLSINKIYQTIKYLRYGKRIQFIFQIIINSFFEITLILLTWFVDNYITNECINDYLFHNEYLYYEFENILSHLGYKAFFWFLIFISSIIYIIYKANNIKNDVEHVDNHHNL